MELIFLFSRGHQFDPARLGEISMNLSTLAFRMNEVLEVHQTFRPDEMVLLRVVIGKKTSMLPHVVSSFVSNMEEMGGLMSNSGTSA